MTVIEYCREKTDVRELVIIRSGGYAHADVIDSSYGHIKVLDHQGAYVSVPCTYLDIK